MRKMATTSFRPSVYVASYVPDLASAVKELSPNIDVIDVPLDSGKLSEKDKTTICTRAEVLLTDMPIIIDVMYTAKKLKWAQSTWAGVEVLMKGLDSRKPVPALQITRTGRGFGTCMAEYVLGQIIAKERHFIHMYEDQKLRQFETTRKYKKFRWLSSLRLGIIGAGEIGTEIGNLCKQIGMEIWVLSRQPRPEHAHFDAQKTPHELPELLQNCDYICSVLPSTPATRGLLSGDVLENCKDRKSVIINVGRGDVVDEGSIAKAIKNEWIGGAILDVFDPEPLPTDSVLWTLPNVIITPHVSGPCFVQPVAEAFIQNLQNYVEGKPLNWKVDFNKGY